MCRSHFCSSSVALSMAQAPIAAPRWGVTHSARAYLCVQPSCTQLPTGEQPSCSLVMHLAAELSSVIAVRQHSCKPARGVCP